MKRIGSWLTVTLLLLAMAGCRPEVLSLRAYGDVVTSALEGKWAYGAGALYDLNGDGVEELILQHSRAEFLDMAEGKHEAPVCGLSLYTMTEDGPLALIDHEDLYIEVGGNGGETTVVQREGALYLMVVTSGEDGVGCESVRETTTLYTVSKYCHGPVYAERAEEAVYCYTIGDYGFPIFREASVNGEGCTEEEYDAWQTAFEPLFVLNPYTYNDPELGNPEVRSLEDLAVYLNEME